MTHGRVACIRGGACGRLRVATACAAALACTGFAGAYGEPLHPWSSYGATPGGTHFSTASQITPANVAGLELAWEHRSGDMREARAGGEDSARGENSGFRSASSFQATPILVEDTLYYCSPFNKVFALDAETGEERWAFDPGVSHEDDVLPNCRGVSSWRSGKPGFCEHRILMGTLDARLIALDAGSGKPCPDFGADGAVDLTAGISPHRAVEYSITSPPAILNDLAITGAMVLDNVRTDAPSGVVRAYDVRSGELVWAWNPVPPQIAPLNDDGTYRSGTTNVWSIISVDPERNLVFVPTGNTSPDYFGGHRQGLDDFSSSVVALDGRSGERVWHFQMVHHDIWDYDTPAQPTLVDLTVNGQQIPAVVQVTKMGLTFVLHRETGAPVFGVEERPVPQAPVAGEYLSPTQPFPVHVPPLLAPITADDAWGLTPWDRGRCRDAIAALRNEGFYTPPSLTGSLFHPSNAGGNNWGSPAIDPVSGVMVVVTMRVPSSVKLIPRAECNGVPASPQNGTPYCVQTGQLSSPLGVPCTAPPWGTLDAVDLAAGTILWSVPLGTTRHIAPFPFWWIRGVPGIGGPMITASGLVFAGATTDHYFRAFDLASGAELWTASLPTTASSVPMSYQLTGTGRQFVVVAVGGHWSGTNPPGDHLMAFALPTGATARGQP